MNRMKNPTKTSQPYIASYQQGGMVKAPPMDIDSISAESPAMRAKYEKQYGLAPAGAMRKPPAVVKSKVPVTPKKK